MKTVVDANSSVRTVSEGCLVPPAAHIVKEDVSSSITKDATTNGDWCCV